MSIQKPIILSTGMNDMVSAKSSQNYRESLIQFASPYN